ncbi:phosphoenolpyruvate mutase [Streptomyces sp. NPDC007095]|jgi:phosphoenolpyruvate phosphomutase|uniref:phosphoenolpyruvate mutase n=1 Tax=Streptomyces sp. NPDC007095 TaxID=3154482 RepID=UPI001C56C642
MLRSDHLEFILEAHNGISASIAEEAGFRGIWASGLALSAQFGVRDNNETSWSQVVDMVEFMADATSVPILLDGDTGYGNFNNARRLVRKLEQRGIAGVCIEDKSFPKTNSFINGQRQELADIDEFCGKIAAAKDSQLDDDFCVVARVEAYIAGRDTREALARAEAYRRAGADGILIHSSQSKPDQILEFAREWAGRAPLVIVPTKYYSTPTQVFRDAGVSLVIWANHLIRSAVDSMQATARRIFEDESLVEVEDRIASITEIFRLQCTEELAEAEHRYAAGAPATTAVVLAASRGDELTDLTSDRPKTMLSVNGKPLLTRLVELCRTQGIGDISVVAGYRADSVDVKDIGLIVNDDHATNGELASLACARHAFSDEMVILYGDLLFRSYILRELLESESELTVVVDSQEAHPGTIRDDAYCASPDDRSLWGHNVLLQHIGGDERGDTAGPQGRWIGMFRARAGGRAWIEEALDALSVSPRFDHLTLSDLLNHIVEAGHPVRVLYIHGHWLDVNSLGDLEQAGRFTAGQP